MTPAPGLRLGTGRGHVTEREAERGRKDYEPFPSTQEDFLEEESRAVQFFHALGLIEGGSGLVLGLLVSGGVADTENLTQACEGTLQGDWPQGHRPHICLPRRCLHAEKVAQSTLGQL